MSTLFSLISRNTKMFFKDKGMFFASLITPFILLALYATFLGNTWESQFISIGMSKSLAKAAVGSQLMSSLLAVSCVTVSFCSNMLMVQDKVTGALNDLRISPLKPHLLALGYYFTTAITSLLVCYAAMGLSLVYIAFAGWYLSFADVLLIALDVFLVVMFGTALSSIINSFLSTQGQISAVGTIISAGYGFICGAYIPMSQFGETLRNAVAFFPGTYCTSLLRNHSLRGILSEMSGSDILKASLSDMKDAFDCNIYFFDKLISIKVMYIFVVVSIILLVLVYILIHMIKNKKAIRK